MSSVTDGMGEDWGGLLTSGLGYVQVLILVEEIVGAETKKKIIQPQIIYIKREVAIVLERLEIIKLSNKELKTKALSIKSKLTRILFLIEELNIALPYELKLFLSDLGIFFEGKKELTQVGLSIARKEEIIKKINNLSTLKYFDKEIGIDQLNLMKKSEILVQFDVLNLIKKIQEFIHIAIPNIYLLKQKQLAEYIELLDLLDQITEE